MIQLENCFAFAFGDNIYLSTEIYILKILIYMSIYRVRNKKWSMTKIVINPKQYYITSLNLAQLIYLADYRPSIKNNWIEKKITDVVAISKKLAKIRSGKFLYK